MNRRKKETKQILLVSIFIISIFLTSTQIFNAFNFAEINDDGQDLYDNELQNLSHSSDPYLSDYYINKSGDDQDVRIYATNTSSLVNNQKYFDIPSMSNSIDSYLTCGDFNFTFHNNFTTDYVLEDNSALEATSFIEFDMNRNPGYSNMTLSQGTNSTNLDLDDLNDDSISTYSMLHGDNGIINFTLTADFSDTSFVSGTPDIDLDFDRSLILGFIISLQLKTSMNASMIIKMKDSIGLGWINVTNSISLNANLGIHDIEKRIINENLKYINLTNINEVQFYISRGDTQDYNVTIYELGEFSTYAFDIPITSSDHIALEFDLKGENSTVNGFYAWIRTLNLTEALSSELNITLYKANTTISRIQSNLVEDTIEPDYAEEIDSLTLDYLAYHGDNLTYFGFNIPSTSSRVLYNYFIVIKSNNSNLVYSLVTLPRETFGDPDKTVEHQVKLSTDNGITWSNAIKDVDVSYNSESLDASSFKLNVTRGYMPSDFIISEDDELNIQDIPIENQVINTDSSSSLTWGKGQWNNNFTNYITSNPQHDYQIDLNWNNSIIKGFQFDVTYNVKAFWVDPATSSYNVSYDTTPRWTFDYTFNLNHVNFDQWDFLEFWFVYPNYFDATNLTDPSSIDIYNNTESIVEDLQDYDKTNVSLANAASGLYTLELISPNAIHDMHSYIDYSGILWETNGFMYGDSIIAQLDIQGSDGNPPKNGNASVVLFYPDNSTKYSVPQRDDNSGVKEENVLKYDFDNVTILDVDTSVPLLGKYYLGFFWTNGSAIGCKKLTIYIDAYDVILYNFSYDPILETNDLSGVVVKESGGIADNYSILIATINETTGQTIPNFYAVNQSDVNQEYVLDVSGEEVPILLKSFLQNETILNPAEKISFIMSLQNLHEIIDLDAKINVKLVALGNEDWIIDETTSVVKNLKLNGDPSGGDVQEFTVELEIPDFEIDGTWNGQNAPIRKGGVKTIIDIYIGDEIVGTYKSNEYSLLINDTEDILDGYIIALKYDEKKPAPPILKPFERDECTYIPDSTKFIVNIYDDNFVSSYAQFNNSFDLYMNSEFRDVIATPEDAIRGNILNISSTLTTEFGTELANKNVTCQYNDVGEWINISSQLTDINGSTLFEIDTLSLNDEETLLFRLIWPGDQYLLNLPYNISVDLLGDVINVLISLQEKQVQVYRNTKTTFIINLENLGSYDVRISNITIDVNPNLPNKITEINYLLLNQFSSGYTTTIIIEVDVSSITQFLVSVSADVQNLLTEEIITIHASDTFETFDRSLIDYMNDYFILIMFAIFGILALVTFLFVKMTKKSIETPIEEPAKRKARRGKYLSVSEIPPRTIEAKKEQKPSKKKADKKISKKKIKEPEPEKKKSTDLDSLLEEKGLKDDDK
ncbi:MAG: hypothetical protein ACTSXN_08600 [Promethearchaeota archaeon]